MNHVPDFRARPDLDLKRSLSSSAKRIRVSISFLLPGAKVELVVKTTVWKLNDHWVQATSHIKYYRALNNDYCMTWHYFRSSFVVIRQKHRTTRIEVWSNRRAISYSNWTFDCTILAFSYLAIYRLRTSQFEMIFIDFSQLVCIQ